MTKPTPANLRRAKAFNTLRYSGTPSDATDMIHATGAAVELARAVAWLRGSGDPVLMRAADALEHDEHWEGDGG